jgi:hypothetical protein
MTPNFAWTHSNAMYASLRNCFNNTNKESCSEARARKDHARKVALDFWPEIFAEKMVKIA